MAGTGNTSIKSYNFFVQAKVEATYIADGGHDFVDSESGVIFLSHTVLLSNDTPLDIWFSYDGVNDYGRVLRDEVLQMDFRRERKIWLRGTVGPTNFVRFWAY